MGESRSAQTYEAGQASRTDLVHKFKNARCGRVSEKSGSVCRQRPAPTTGYLSTAAPELLEKHVRCLRRSSRACCRAVTSGFDPTRTSLHRGKLSFGVT